MEYTGSQYDGDFVKGRMEGQGTYTFPNGTKYVGEMRDGAFHGKGTLHFPNGSTFAATWENGRSVGTNPARGDLSFGDGLAMEEGDWKYCDEDDRRFYQEHLHGVNAAGASRKVDRGEPRAIPEGTYDCGDGYFDVRDGTVYTYEGEFLRTPDKEEAEWIVRACRISLAS